MTQEDQLFTLLYYRRCSGLFKTPCRLLCTGKNPRIIFQNQWYFLSPYRNPHKRILFCLSHYGQSWHLLETAPESFRKFRLHRAHSQRSRKPALFSGFPKSGQPTALASRLTENQGSRRALYLICDHVFRFWYTCDLPYLSEIEMGEGDKIFEEQIVPLLENYTKDTFPDICREFLELEEKCIQRLFLCRELVAGGDSTLPKSEGIHLHCSLFQR